MMCPCGNHHNSFVATGALVHTMQGSTLLVSRNQKSVQLSHTMLISRLQDSSDLGFADHFVS